MGKRLVVIAGKEMGQTFDLPEDGALLMGRGPETHTRFTDLSVSRDHCRVEVKGGRVEITDSGKSAIGTFVNNQPIDDAHSLKAGDVIRLGEGTQLRLELDVEDILTEETVRGDRVEFLRKLAQEMSESAKAKAPARPQPPEGTIQVVCSCGQELHAREKYAGTRVRCPSCKAILTLPGRPALAQPVDPAAPPRRAVVPPSAKGGRRTIKLPHPLAVGVVLVVVVAAVCLGAFWWQQGQDSSSRERPARKATPSAPEKKY